MKQQQAKVSAASKDSHLALRRVERQQVLIEKLHAAHGTRLQISELARDLHISARTLSRDIERLRHSGIPIHTHPGRGGGVSAPHITHMEPITFTLPEAAALMSSLAALGPSVSSSATTSIQKLIDALSTGYET